MYRKKEFEKRYLLIIVIVVIAILLVVLSVALKKDRNLSMPEKIVKDSGTFIINVISSPLNFVKEKLRESKEKNDIYEKYISEFKECISDDLNTANAITLIYEVLKSEANDSTKKAIIEYFDQVLSLDLTKEEKKNIDVEYILNMIEKRNIAKQNKDYATADAIRDELLTKGIILKDNREGTTYEVI